MRLVAGGAVGECRPSSAGPCSQCIFWTRLPSVQPSFCGQKSKTNAWNTGTFKPATKLSSAQINGQGGKQILPRHFLELFWMTLVDLLANILHGELEQDPLCRGPLTVEAQVAVGLLATSQHILTTYLFLLLIFLYYTITCQESIEVKHGIPGIVGTIDGTHIPLLMPAGDGWKGYINWKGWASITFQCIIDGDGDLTDVVVYSGNQKLGSAWYRTHKVQKIIPMGSYLIGNAGYPEDVGVLVPYPSVATTANEQFNFIHSSNPFRILLTAQRANAIRYTISPILE
ncbi:hypothetical protein VP01_201g9 [Puccinia sorghi]|uniref:DDE Tnp4 domain-containing protein n=1 Tax=Puccinia sorghi TaxID=27349 RepID=A0A0L6VD15_9BASI|nr:hypothetical protein VP01_201g9 [Puccinia sorghi]